MRTLVAPVDYVAPSAPAGNGVRIAVHPLSPDAGGKGISILADSAAGLIEVGTGGTGAAITARLPFKAFALLADLVDDAPSRLIPMPPALIGIARLLDEAERTDAVSEIYRAAKATELVCEIVRRLDPGDERAPADQTVACSVEGRRLSVAMRMIDEGWREAPTIDRLARACGLNREKLTRGFRARYGCTVGEAIAERRLRHAEALLGDPDLAIGTVGYRSGYRSEASFCRAFRRRFGVPPNVFRKQGHVA
jgi:AraC family transcriptional activator of pyochelin receptor